MFLRFLQAIGFAVCHQLPQRSLSYGIGYVPLCARDTGIYFGFLTSFIYLTVINRKHEHGFPPWYVIAFGLAGIGLMAIDGFTSYGGFRPTTNEIRLITGILAGSALPLGLIPIFNYQAWEESKEAPIMRGFVHIVLFLIVIAGTFLAFQVRPGFLFWPVATLAGFTVLFIFTYINLIILTLIPFWAQKAEHLKDLAIPFVIALFLTAIELIASYALHAFMLSRLTG